MHKSGCSIENKYKWILVADWKKLSQTLKIKAYTLKNSNQFEVIEIQDTKYKCNRNI